MMNKVELANVSFSYPNGFQAVADVSLTIQENEKVAIIGQNGAGKTTTVKMMNGLLRPSTGIIRINEQDIAGQTTATISRTVGYVFQNPDDQLFNQTVYDELAYTLKYDRKNPAEIKAIVKRTAEICHLTEHLNKNPYDLPLSIRKFVTIGIIIANNCDVVILDEPTVGQDLFGLQWLTDIIDFLHAEGKTVITISHDMEFVVDNFERVIIMANRKVIGDGVARDVFWDHELLEEAHIKQPMIAQLAHRLQMLGNVITAQDFAKGL